MLILYFLLLLVSFVILYKGADWLVDGASKVAVNLGISKVVVGVTMVAFGTSAPELFVNVIAAARGKTDFALSNVSGSNLTNICLGFGICSLIGTLVIERQKFLIDLILFFLAPGVIFFFALIGGFIPVWAVIFLAVPFAVYIHSLKHRLFETTELDESIVKTSTAKALGIFLAGVFSLYIAGELVLKSAVSIGEAFGISDSVMGLTVVAIGTSIPDVTASIIAFKRKESLIAVGNLVGSNIFNILLVISATLLVSFKGLPADKDIVMDYGLVLICSGLFAAFAIWKQKTNKLLGIILISIFVSYMTYRVWSSMAGA